MFTKRPEYWEKPKDMEKAASAAAEAIPYCPNGHENPFPYRNSCDACKNLALREERENPKLRHENKEIPPDSAENFLDRMEIL